MSTLLIDHTPGQSRYGKLAQALRDRILQGEWAPGEVIPAESTLAQNYGVSTRGRSGKPLSLLVEDGVLATVGTVKGTFVSPTAHREAETCQRAHRG